MTGQARAGTLMAGMSLVTAGSLIANAASYLLHVPASSWLGPSSYGAFASLLAAQLLLAVPALALQMVVARRIVTGRLAGVDRIGEARHLGAATVMLVAVVAVVVVPIASWALGTSLVATLLALSTAPILVVLAAEQGILQGTGRFGALALVIAGAGLARVVPAILVLWLGGGVEGALGAGALGTVVAAIAARRLVGEAPAFVEGQGSARPDVGAVLRASQVQLVIMAFTAIDLLMARMVLDEVAAGVYALGAVAAKVAFWLPFAVGVVLFPRMADPARTRESLGAMLAVLAVLGTGLTVAAWLLAPIVPGVVGEDYRPVVGVLWLFAAHGAVLSAVQGALLSVIARDRTAVAALAWTGLVVLAGMLLLVPTTVTAFILTALLVATVTLLAVVGAVLRSLREPYRSPPE
ncbi:polysaccharide biosynthesis protein [Lolliginicoccus levis]|uniref:polysaccharide biosynthesis protein n=1 Tax=Lolliginicoccus levis TaxID=2919542 RepID=UPI002852CAAA|nr:polysaccharide biosynthesis protein [Lolliginicoccus levis]